MKINALLIEDEKTARDTIKSYLSKYFPEITVVREIDNEPEAIHALIAKNYDVIFLDVQLKHGTGVDVLQKVRKKGLRIIFTTAYDNFTIEAFKNKAFGYLLKPINPIDFKEIVNRVIKDIRYIDATAKKIKFPTNQGNAYVNIHSIVRCESESNYTHVYCADKSNYVISRTLKYVEENILDTPYFLRIHQSHLVNVQFIDQTKITPNEITLKDGTSLPVSRSKKNRLREVLASTND